MWVFRHFLEVIQKCVNIIYGLNGHMLDISELYSTPMCKKKEKVEIWPTEKENKEVILAVLVWSLSIIFDRFPQYNPYVSVTFYLKMHEFAFVFLVYESFCQWKAWRRSLTFLFIFFLFVRFSSSFILFLCSLLFYFDVVNLFLYFFQK